ncbi:hypothetical protein ACJA29_03635 [Metamycoplasma sualvi]|uniref:hypothetical protein n=1 Tax=Metamycoplasma sualvi TaxID=2125 RepID=UPI003873C20D
MKKILAVSALVSLIPLASISIVSCKNTGTNNQEQQKPTPDNPSSPSTPDTPEIGKPEGGGSDSDQNKPSETPSNPDVAQQLLAAKEKFSIVAKDSGHSQVRANEITKENFDTYFTLNGKMDGFSYVLNKITPIGENQLEIYYKIELNGQSVDYSTTFNGFKGLNQIDYDYKNQEDFFAVALNKEHLNTIAFAAQMYTNAELTKPGWTLNFDNKANYELTKTSQYIILNNGVKMNIYKIKFTAENPIFIPNVLGGPYNAPFTEAGKEYHDKNGGFQIAIQDGQDGLVI